MIVWARVKLFLFGNGEGCVVNTNALEAIKERHDKVKCGSDWAYDGQCLTAYVNDVGALLAEVRRLASYGYHLQVKRERDAAIADFTTFGRMDFDYSHLCEFCISADDCRHNETIRAAGGRKPSSCEDFTWRGVKEAAG